MQRLRQQEAQASSQEGEQAQDDLRQRWEDAPRVQDVGAEEGEGVARHMDGGHSLAPHAGGDQLGGILGARVVGHRHPEAADDRKTNQQGRGCKTGSLIFNIMKY